MQSGVSVQASDTFELSESLWGHKVRSLNEDAPDIVTDVKTPRGAPSHARAGKAPLAASTRLPKRRDAPRFLSL